MVISNTIPKLNSYKITKSDFSEKGEVYILEVISMSKFIKVNENTKNFLEEIDGISDYSQIANNLNKKYGLNLTEESVKNIIINDLGKNGLIEGIESENERKFQSRLWFHINLMDGKKFEKIAKRLTFLFNFKVALLLLILSLIVFTLVLSDSTLQELFRRKHINYFQNINLFMIFFILIITSMLHELGHIVASFRYNSKPRNVGIGLYLLMPVLFVDLSDSWVLDRKKRVVIDLGGMYFQIISVMFLFPMTLIENSVFNSNNYKIIVISTIANILFNLNPNLKMDGYWALSDLTGVVNIHNRTRDKIVNMIKRLFGKKDLNNENYNLTDKAKKILRIWSITYTLITGLFIYIGIRKMMSLISANIISLYKLLALLIGYIIIKLVISFVLGRIRKLK